MSSGMDDLGREKWLAEYAKQAKELRAHPGDPRILRRLTELRRSARTAFGVKFEIRHGGFSADAATVERTPQNKAEREAQYRKYVTRLDELLSGPRIKPPRCPLGISK